MADGRPPATGTRRRGAEDAEARRELEREHTLVLVDAHSDASAAPDSDAVRRGIRRVGLDVLPDPVEVVRAGNNAVYYGATDAYLKSAVYIMPHSRHVNLGFFQGAHLADPDGLLEGTGKTLRHVKLKKVDDVDTPAIRALLQRAWDYSPE